MGEVKVVLTLMNADGELTERVLPTSGETTFTQLAKDRFAPFHSEESQAAGKTLALFREFQFQAPIACALPPST